MQKFEWDFLTKKYGLEIVKEVWNENISNIEEAEEYIETHSILNKENVGDELSINNIKRT